MMHTNTFYFKAFMLIALLASVGLYTGMVKAQNTTAPVQTSAEVRFINSDEYETIEFSEKTDSSAAKKKLHSVFESGLDEEDKNIVSDPESYTSYVRYIPLKPSQPNRFIAQYAMSGPGNGCARLGCEIQIFENYENKKWRLVMNIYAHGLAIGTKTESNTDYREIYLQSSPTAKDQALHGIQQIAGAWRWEEDQYAFNSKVIIGISK